MQPSVTAFGVWEFGDRRSLLVKFLCFLGRHALAKGECLVGVGAPTSVWVGPFFTASSPESVGKIWLGEVSELVI